MRSATNNSTYEEEYALPTVASIAPSREYYRHELRGQIRLMFDQHGIVPIIDWMNDVTKQLKGLQREVQIDNLDVLQEELANFFLEKYPQFGRDKYVPGSNIVRLNQSSRR